MSTFVDDYTHNIMYLYYTYLFYFYIYKIQLVESQYNTLLSAIISRRNIMPFALIHIYCYSFMFMWKSSHRALKVSYFLQLQRSQFYTTFLMLFFFIVINQNSVFSWFMLFVGFSYSWYNMTISDIANVTRFLYCGYACVK